MALRIPYVVLPVTIHVRIPYLLADPLPVRSYSLATEGDALEHPPITPQGPAAKTLRGR